MRCINCAVIGDGMVGKTCLLYAYISNTTPKNYAITIFDNYNVNVTVNNEQIELKLLDTAGEEDYHDLRRQVYPMANVFIVCFAVNQLASFENIEAVWLADLRREGIHKPIILVATKIDTRDDPKELAEMARRGRTPITTAQGESLARKIGAASYVECSAMRLEGIKEVFNAAIGAALKDIDCPRQLDNARRKNKQSCHIL